MFCFTISVTTAAAINTKTAHNRSKMISFQIRILKNVFFYLELKRFLYTIKFHGTFLNLSTKLTKLRNMKINAITMPVIETN